MSHKTKKGVLMLAFGGADSVDNVEPFLKNILKGRPVSTEFVEKTKERYRLIGGRSPLLKITAAQAKAVEELLNKDGYDHRVYVGMRFWHPYIKDTLAEMKADGVEETIAVVMASFSSLAATGGYATDVEAAVKSMGGVPSARFVSSYHINPEFIKCVTEKLDSELKAFPDKNEVLVIFSNHSLPMMVLEGDPYEMMVHQTVNEIIKRTGPINYRVSYQSQGAGTRDWIGPKTEDVIIEAKKKGKKAVLVVPLGFVTDHIETLYDIDIVFKKTAESLGLAFRRSASLNTDGRFMELIANLIKKYGEKK